VVEVFQKLRGSGILFKTITNGKNDRGWKTVALVDHLHEIGEGGGVWDVDEGLEDFGVDGSFVDKAEEANRVCELQESDAIGVEGAIWRSEWGKELREEMEKSEEAARPAGVDR
jgi:hypothetical protein